jgi:hypothetical protein
MTPEERRRHPRHPATWPLRLWLTERSFVAGHAVNASRSGVLAELTWLPAGIVKLEERYVLEIEPGTDTAVKCPVVVRRLSLPMVGLESLQEIDVA